MQTLLLKAVGGKGEGSRGGHIIGHTKKGNFPIYASAHRAYSKVSKDVGKVGANAAHVKAALPHYSAADHADASKAHWQMHAEHDTKRIEAKYAGDKKAVAHHAELAEKHLDIGVAHDGLVAQARSAKMLGKSLDALHPSDGLHQMGAQMAQKFPKMSPAEHMAESSKFAKTGQPHMAIGHMMAASFKSSVAKKSMAAEVLEDYLSKALPKAPGVSTSSGKAILPASVKTTKNFATMHANFTAQDHKEAAAHHEAKAATAKGWQGTLHRQMRARHLTAMGSMGKSLSKAAKHYATTSSGAAILSPMHSGYDGVDMHAHHAETYKGMKHEVAINKTHAPIVKKMYPGFTKQDHHDAYRVHEGNNNHAIAGAHFAASGFLKPKGVAKSLSKAALKGEGSRGGHIIAHHKNGDPVYASKANANPKTLGRFGSSDNGKPINQVSLKRPKDTDYSEDEASHLANAHRVIAAHPEFTGDDHKSAFYALAYARGTGSGARNKQGRAHNHAASLLGVTDHDAKKSISSHGFNDLMKASGITMWAPKPNRAELTRLS